MRKLRILIVAFLVLAIITIIYFTNEKAPFYRLALTSDVVDLSGWKMSRCLKYKNERSYIFEKSIADTNYFVGFTYLMGNELCPKKKAFYVDGFTKDFPICDSLFLRFALNLEGDTLYAFKRDTTEDYNSDKRTVFFKGRYYYYYTFREIKLDSCQVTYFEKHKDSLIKAGANTIPEFDENCEMIKEK